MKKKLVSFVCAVMAALCLVVSVPAQAYAASEDEIALQYAGISEISANLVFKDGTAHCRGTTHAYTGYTVKLVMVLKRSNVEYARWEETVLRRESVAQTRQQVERFARQHAAHLLRSPAHDLVDQRNRAIIVIADRDRAT